MPLCSPGLLARPSPSPWFSKAAVSMLSGWVLALD